MRAAWRSFGSKVQRIFRLIVLFLVLRLLVGLAAIVLFDRDTLAWGWQATAVVLAMIIVYALVGVVVRRRAPSAGA
jgi:membrane protein YdbS with pleckstrin-like domain